MGWNHFGKIYFIFVNLEISVISQVISDNITAKQMPSIKLKSVDIHIACLIVQFVANNVLILLFMPRKEGTKMLSIETIQKKVENSKFINVKLKRPNYAVFMAT